MRSFPIKKTVIASRAKESCTESPSQHCYRLLCLLVLPLLRLQHCLRVWRVFLSPPAGHGGVRFSDGNEPNMHSTCFHVDESCCAAPLQYPGEFSRRKKESMSFTFHGCLFLSLLRETWQVTAFTPLAATFAPGAR